MNDHNLDDLIIGDPETQPKNPKTLLTIIALLVVILIVGLILWALLFDSPDETQPPTATTQTTQAQPLDAGLKPLDGVDDGLPPLTLDPLDQPGHAPAPHTQASRPAPTPASQPTQQPAPTPMQQPETITPISQPESEPISTFPPVTKPIAKPTSRPTSAPAQSTKHTTPSRANGELIRNADKPIYYIQVGAFKHDPNPRFMKKLKNAGFTFITQKKNGIRKVRVGPYDSYNEAKAALPVVKRKIGVDGLIVKF